MIDDPIQTDSTSNHSTPMKPTTAPEPEHVSRLVAYLQGLLDQSEGLPLYQTYRADLEQATPQSVLAAYYQLYASGVPVPQLLGILDKSINVFHRSLSALMRDRQDLVKSVPFLDALRQENEGLLARLAAMRQVLTSQPADARQQLLEQVRELRQFDDHYQKKENILFPYMERKMEQYRGLGLMWALHDEIRQRLKAAIACLEQKAAVGRRQPADEADQMDHVGHTDHTDHAHHTVHTDHADHTVHSDHSDRDGTGSSDRELNVALGQLIFGLHGMVNKEEWILFPIAVDLFSSDEWQDMAQQSLDYAFPFVEQAAIDALREAALSGPSVKRWPGSGDSPSPAMEALICYQSGTGSLSLDQITQVFAALPVDLTVVDENNRVVYFTRPQDRIFPRSPAIIGRSVDRCHPPQSVGKVMEIIEAFRSGSKQEATFWINLRGRKILIRYFALRDGAGAYKGTLEVSQDITDWHHLDGEKRLVDWQEHH
jgi:hypothetical protein